ncbi:uncharacterized protein LOC134814220 [Bolinopsis microptera]|uniref:uncharacterized protein LOC134814220 n=1 Tax=Bolinopsis microptera TaxID=2820187 RepID=UPI00307A755D
MISLENEEEEEDYLSEKKQFYKKDSVCSLSSITTLLPSGLIDSGNFHHQSNIKRKESNASTITTLAKTFIDDDIVYFSPSQQSQNTGNYASVISFNMPCQHTYYKEHRWTRNGRKHLEFHTPNSKVPPNMAQISIALEFIEETFDNGGKTFIRSYSKACRSAVLMACYLMSNHSFSVKQALQNLREIQPNLSFSELQLECLKNFSVMLLREYDDDAIDAFFI